jgi:hypothetical protein
VKSSPRIDRRLIRALPALDDPTEPIAETRRRLGALAESLDLPRPSYERVRQLVHANRRVRPGRTKAELLADLALYTGPPQELIGELLSADTRA